MLQVIKFCHYLVPDPISVIVTSDLDSPIRPIGSDVSLTCTVELSPAVDIPLTHRESARLIRLRIYAVFGTKTEERRSTVRAYAAPSLYRNETILTDIRYGLRRNIRLLPSSERLFPASCR